MEVVLDAVSARQASVIPVLGFATLTRFDLAQRLLDSIDYPVEHLVIVDNSGKQEFEPLVNPFLVKNLWLIRVPHGLGANGAWNLIIKSTPFAPYWVIPNDDSWFEPGALKTIAEEVDTEAFNFLDIVPKWSCVIPTEGSVRKAGLWDEAFHPIYFDDVKDIMEIAKDLPPALMERVRQEIINLGAMYERTGGAWGER